MSKSAFNQGVDDGQVGAGVLTAAVRGSNQSGMRAHNERLVLTLLRQRGPLAKADIARTTGLSAQTVSVIMRALERDGLLTRGEPQRGRVGQPSVPMALAADGAYFLGLKVGRRSLDLVLIDFVGRVEGRVHITHKFPTPEGVVRFANSAIDQLLGQLTGPQRARVSGLGIAIPFQLWDWAKPLGVKPGELAEWRDRDVAREIAESWDFPVYLKNDASAACGAELVFGEKDRPSDFLYFFIGFFVGGGLVVDNALYTGRTGNAAALGSIPLGMSGSQTRQLVDVASLASLENALIAVGGNGDMIWENPKSWSVPDAILDRWMDEACEGLAYAILSAVCLIDFPKAMIDGWLPDDIRAEIVKRTRDRVATANLAGIATPDVRSGTIGSDARSLGAASLPLSERFLVDKDAFLMR